MKKFYSKPEIMFDDFTLSESIAGDCEAPYVGNPSKGSCAVIGTGNIAIFDGNVGGGVCKFTPTDLGGTDDQWDGACYHVPTDSNNLFNS